MPSEFANVAPSAITSQDGMETQLLKVGDTYIVPQVADGGQTYVELVSEEELDSIHDHIEY